MHIFRAFETDAHLKKFWHRLRASPYLPISETPFLQTFLNYFDQTAQYVQQTFTDAKDVTFKANFNAFLDYLTKNYFSVNSRYPREEWCHFVGAPTTIIALNSTNLLESANNNLKKRFPRTGHVGLKLR